uniref:Uncharacterized protein n=1 Tax=Trichogramma kaykai TaxID=54128 RepID=A0ABD2WZP5_9HYME
MKILESNNENQVAHSNCDSNVVHHINESNEISDHIEIGESSDYVESNELSGPIDNDFHMSEDDDNPFPHNDSDFDSFSDDSNEDECEKFEKLLGDAFIATDMNHVQIRAVLEVLRTHACFEKLHKDPRTILRTPCIKTPTLEVAGGEYLHLGFENAVKDTLRSTSPRNIPDLLKIDFSTDGAGLDKSSLANNIWPISVRITNISRTKPELVCLWKGAGKPTDAVEFMKGFVDDVLSVIEKGGVNFNGKVFPISLRCFIADAPARAFIVGHLGHNGRIPCSKCWIIGEYIRDSRVMVYRGTELTLRTNEEYRNKIDGEHHKEGVGALDRLPLQFVDQVVFEYMHLACMGVMKKFLEAIIDGKYSPTSQISKDRKVVLKNRLIQIKKYCPGEFARKPFDIDNFSKFKATEFRQILLYTGSVAFCGLVTPAIHLHFLLLNFAMRILVSSNSDETLLNYAEQFLKIYVNRSEDVFGLEYLSYVTHGLLHLVEDYKNFGPLDSFSAFPYENSMTYFRKACRKPHMHLQQIYRRRVESLRKKPTMNTEKPTTLKKRHWNTHLHEPLVLDYDNFQMYSKLETSSMTLSFHESDNTVILTDLRIGIVKNFIQLYDGKCFLAIQFFEEIENLTSLGSFESSQVGTFLVHNLSKNVELIPLNLVGHKCFRMPYWRIDNATEKPENDYYVISSLISSNC